MIPLNLRENEKVRNSIRILWLFNFFQGQVRLRQFLGRVLWLGEAKGPSTAARTGQGTRHCGHLTDYILGTYEIHVHDHLILVNLLFFIIFGLGQVKTISGPTAAVMAGQEAERRVQDRLGGRAPRLGHSRGPGFAAT